MPLTVSPQVARFINKSVPLRFNGRDLVFCLSHGLFSSFDIDEGTRLLLKSLAQKIEWKSVRTALDIGCGVGVIGACVAAQCPDATVQMQDRDALAVAVARENCRLNGLPRVTAECTLAFHGLQGRRFDLVTSNLPAKAGAPVLEAMLRHAASSLGPEGLAAVVIVAPLAGLVRAAISALGCELTFAEGGNAYSVFHFRAGSAPTETAEQMEEMQPYLRGRGGFEAAGISYVLETSFSLPDFDSLGHDLRLCVELCSHLRGGNAGFWNPGQGHLAAALSDANGPGLSAVVVAGRDDLECRMTVRNLAARNVPVSQVHRLASEVELASALESGSLDNLIALPHPIPRSPWQDDLLHAARQVLRTGGHLLVAGTSTDMHRFLQHARGLSLVASKKRAGFRAAVLRKTDPIPPSPG